MAQIAAIFHWPRADLESLTLFELIAWEQRAVRTWNRMWGGKPEGEG